MKKMGVLLIWLWGINLYGDIDYWLMFRHDPQHTGRSPYSGPSKCNEKWVYALADKDRYFESSPTVKGLDMEPDPSMHPMIYIGNFQTGRVFGFKDTCWQDGGNWYAEALLKWSKLIDENPFPNGSSSTPALGKAGSVVERELYIGSNLMASVFKLDIKDEGNFLWDSPFRTNGRVTSSPVISYKYNLIIFGSHDEKIYAIDRDKNFKWEVETDGKCPASPALSLDEETVYMPSKDGHLYAIETATGDIRWTYPIRVSSSTIAKMGSPSVDGNGIIYQGGYSRVYAINPDGTEKWTSVLRNYTYSSIAISADNSTIYVGGGNVVYALETNAGGIVWRTSLTEEGEVDPLYGGPILSANGYLYIGTGNSGGGRGDGELWVLNAESGTIVCSYDTHDELLNTPAIGPLNTVYFGDCSGARLYAIWDKESNSIGVEEEKRKLSGVELSVFPNPVRGRAKIVYKINRKMNIKVSIFDITGREVCVLEKGEKGVGTYCLNWDSRMVRSGVYFVFLKVGEKKVTHKIFVM